MTVRFSLMPREVSRLIDVRTHPVEHRIAAIDDFVAAGSRGPRQPFTGDRRRRLA
jgi:hypothetical protein